ncbi:clathrin light chain 1 [Pyrus ussuriensis x Pyrus communis]|uniref:Clathrin light chain 1 n=1 Tax=Pyrus ussuriensis x Pyrus communis TaxID=2448454 RepID=A0A5N5FMJ8_9ROSA|nr:clathrin light chain 1 [Pyrus ussuriensis x Pyrus communis]
MRGEGFAHREWRRRNVIHLEEKEKREGKMRNQLIDEAEEFKRAFYEKWKLNCETNKAYNRERKKVVILKRIMLFYIFRSPNSLALPPSALLAYFPEVETEPSATHDAAPTCQRWQGCKGRKRRKGCKGFKGWKGYKRCKRRKGGKDAKGKDAKNGKINSPTAAGAAAASAPVSSKPEAPGEPQGEQHSETTLTPAE